MSYWRKRWGRGTERCRTWPARTGWDTSMATPPSEASSQVDISSQPAPSVSRPWTRTGSFSGTRRCRRRSASG